MRFSSAFDPPQPMRSAQAEDRPPETPATPIAPIQADALPDDLDQRVRQVGEWQLEDW